MGAEGIARIRTLLTRVSGTAGTPTQNLFCFELDAMNVPEALATTIRILLMFSIALAHQWVSRPLSRVKAKLTCAEHPCLLGSTNPRPIADHMEPFSTAVFKVLI